MFPRKCFYILLSIIVVGAFLFSPLLSRSNVIKVRNTNNSGTGSLRAAINNAASGDTIFVNVRGTISLSTPLQINKGVTIIGPFPKHLTLSGNSGIRLINIDHAMTDTTKIHGVRMAFGLSGNGGAVKVFNGSFILRHSVIENCTADTSGGAIMNHGYTRIMSSSILSCDASLDRGGAIYSSATSTLQVINSTINGNTSSGRGGAICVNGGNAVIDHSTVVYNSANTEGGGICSENSASVNLSHTILDGNVASSGPEIFSEVSMGSNGYNLIPDTSGGNFNYQSTDQMGAVNPGIPGSGSYKVNGFGMRYFPLSSSSDAIDMGDNTVGPGLDQRGAPRRLDGDTNGTRYADVGAVEYSPFCVTDSGVTGTGTLPNLINAINVNTNPAPPYYICFDYSGGNIDHSNALVLNYRTIIDGYSQEGSRVPGPRDPATGEPLKPAEIRVTLDGGGAVANGFEFSPTADNSVLRGLAVINHASHGVTIEANSVRIAGNHIGVDSSGVNPGYNGNTGVLVLNNSSNSLIGGEFHHQRNVISNNIESQVRIRYDALTDHRIKGNLIGLTADGANRFTNSTKIGIWLENSGNIVGKTKYLPGNYVSAQSKAGIMINSSILTNPRLNQVFLNFVGTDATGTNPFGNEVGILLKGAYQNLVAGNLVSGNVQHGIMLDSMDTDSNYVGGNTIGMGFLNSALPNDGYGIWVGQNVRKNRIGGTIHSNETNVISNNGMGGILLRGDSNVVQGNVIGLDRNASTIHGNQGNGIECDRGYSNLIGGDRDSTRNVISGNLRHGIHFHDKVGFGNVVHGNYIGTDSTGQSGMGNDGHGIHLDSCWAQVVVGDSVPEHGNVILSNGGAGVGINRDPSISYGHVVVGNYIGIDSTETSPVGNSLSGVIVNGDSNIVGYAPDHGNVIAYNGEAGIISLRGEKNSFMVNSIYKNGQLGIDLNGDGVTSNDLDDTDGGPNGSLNYPVLNPASSCDSTSTQVSGNYQGKPNTTFRLEFYLVPNGFGDPTGHGEGYEFFAADTITTNSTGDASFSLTYPATLSPGDSVTAIAISLDSMNTSEFSGNVPYQPPLELAQDSIIHVDCYGNNTGVAVVKRLATGAGLDSIGWYDSSFNYLGVNGDSASGIPAGQYYAIGVDMNGCKDTVVLTINEPPQLTVSAVTDSNESCAGDCDGMVHASASGGTPSYSYSWSPTGVTTDTVAGVCPGNHIVTVVDSNGCQAIDTAVVDTGVSIPSISAYSPSPFCVNGRKDTLSGTPSGGYWTGSGITNSMIGEYDPSVAGIGASEVYYTIDSAGCTFRDTAYNYVYDVVMISVTPDTALVCPGDSALLSATGSGGFNWSPGSSLSDSTISDPKAAPAVPTDYTVIHTDSNGCKDTGSAYVQVQNSFAGSSGDTSICSGDTVQISASGGSSYDWSPGAELSDSTISSPFAFPSSTTTYEVTVTDSNGCTDTDTLQVTVNNLPFANAGGNDSICSNDSVVLGGAPTGPNNATFIWQPGGSLNDSTLEGPTAFPTDTTQYVVQVTDLNGCTNYDTTMVYVIPAPIANAGVNDTICQGDTADLAASGSGTYQWSPSSLVTSPNSTTTQAFPDSTTDFIFSATNSAGCLASDTAKVVVFPKPVLSTSGDTICSGDSASISVSGASSYVWITGETTSSISVAPISDSSYYVQGTSVNGCMSDTNVFVDVRPAFSISASPAMDTICQNDSVSLAASATSGNPSFVWNTGDIGSSIVVSPTQDSTFSVIGSTSYGCEDTAYSTITVNTAPAPPVSSTTQFTLCEGDPVPSPGVDPSHPGTVIWYDDAAATTQIGTGDTISPSFSIGSRSIYATVLGSNGCESTSLSFNVVVSDGGNVSVTGDSVICENESAELSAQGGVSFLWSPSSGLSDTSTPSVTASPVSTTQYFVTAYDSIGCTSTDSITVQVNSLAECDLTVYNAFSPDGDGSNDTWIIEGIQLFPENEVSIFNRWGDAIVTFQGYDNEKKVWDGTNSSGDPMPSGTYFYVIEISGETDRQITGYVQITR